MQALVVLNENVQIVPLAEIPPQVRGHLGGQAGDFALTRPFSRTPSKVIDASTASLLRQFRSPRTIVEGILAYSKEAGIRSTDVLNAAWPLIENCFRGSLLVERGTAAERIQPSFAPGDLIDGNVVEYPVQTTGDSEVYQVRTPGGRLAVLKMAAPGVVQTMETMLAKEADILHRIDGAPAPALLEMKTAGHGRPWLIAEWFDGENVQTKARNLAEGGAYAQIASVCANILDAYATLHERGVIHAGVHPRNILVAESGEVQIVDFRVSHLAGATHAAQSLQDEQFNVATLVYSLLCGNYYADFSLDKDMLLRQIGEDKPLPFERRGAAFSAALETVVMRALEKNADLRFESARHFASAFRTALAPASSAAAPARDRESKALLHRVMQTISEPNRILTYKGPASPAASVTYGHAGIALAALRIASVRDDAHLLDFADAWIERAEVTHTTPFYSDDVQITPETTGVVTPWHTASGIAAVQGMLAAAHGDRQSLDAAINHYLIQTGRECSNADLTAGHAGILLGLTLLLEANRNARPAQFIERGNQLNAKLIHLMESEPAIGAGGTVSYLGIAHGWAGLLYASLRWSQFIGTPPAAVVETRLSQLAALARFTGNGARWPVQASPGSITMPGWCNGSAGYAFLWTLAHSVIGSPLYLDLAEKSAMDAFESSGGGHALCCGFAGQAYAQLTLYNHTGDRTWLQRARILAEKAAAAGNLIQSRDGEGFPYSLYKGDIGVAVLIADLEKPETAAMPFFERA